MKKRVTTALRKKASSSRLNEEKSDGVCGYEAGHESVSDTRWKTANACNAVVENYENFIGAGKISP